MAYCSRDCQKDDRSVHKYVCKEFPVVNGNNALYTTGLWEKHISCLRERAARLKEAEDSETIFKNPWVCNTCREARPSRLIDCKCGYISYCSRKCSKKDSSHKENCSQLSQKRQSYSSMFRRMTYPSALGYALQILTEEGFALDNNTHLEDNLVVHVLTSTALLEAFDHDEELLVSYWEQGFVHLLKDLKQ